MAGGKVRAGVIMAVGSLVGAKVGVAGTGVAVGGSAIGVSVGGTNVAVGGSAVGVSVGSAVGVKVGKNVPVGVTLGVGVRVGVCVIEAVLVGCPVGSAGGWNWAGVARRVGVGGRVPAVVAVATAEVLTGALLGVAASVGTTAVAVGSLGSILEAALGGAA